MKKFLIRSILSILRLLVFPILFVTVAFMLTSFKGFWRWFAVMVARVEELFESALSKNIRGHA